MQDESTEVSELSREILRDLIKNYKKFLDIIPKLSFINRQDLLFVIGQTNVLFRSTLNFSASIRSQTIYRQTNLTLGSDRYKTENMSTQLPDNVIPKPSSSFKDQSSNKPKSSKRHFGVIPNKLIKLLDSTNIYEDRVNTLEQINSLYVQDIPSFTTLSKYINEFIDYLFNLSHEKSTAEDESIAYE